jgi:hypothetical protein
LDARKRKSDGPQLTKLAARQRDKGQKTVGRIGSEEDRRKKKEEDYD